METEFQNATGKSMGEVMRDISEFLSMPFLINQERQINLATLLPDLNMAEQFSFALFSEAETQGWPWERTVNFYRGACAAVLDAATMEKMLTAFEEKPAGEYPALAAKYGNKFYSLDGSYWSTCLALGIDAGEIGEVMQYLRLFTVALMEFAYMEERNPAVTYTWSYYESFRGILDALTAEPEPDPLPLKVRAVGGTSGKRDAQNDSYFLSLGFDIENPNEGHMAHDIQINIVLKDKEGNVITKIGDRLSCMDPSAIYHYGVTRRIRGAQVGSIAATAKATNYLKLKTPLMKHIKLSDLRLSKDAGGLSLSGTMTSQYDCAIRSLTLHYQYLSADNKILGGNSEWILDGIPSMGAHKFTAKMPVAVSKAVKAVYSVDFDPMELI